MVIFCKIVITFLGRNTPNNKFQDVNKFHRCWSPSIMNLEQLIFTWKGRQLVLALLSSINYIIILTLFKRQMAVYIQKK